MPALQPELFDQGATESDLSDLRRLLAERGWQTRKQIAHALGWPERKTRAAAEALGADVVRAQLGFKLTCMVTPDEMPLALRAADAAMSQGKHMIRYALALKKRLHELIG